MKVDWKTPEDAPQLRALIAGEQNAKQRDRFRVVLLAGCGLGDQPECDRELIAAAVGRARQFVDQWVGRYRAGGIEALYPHKQRGRLAGSVSRSSRNSSPGWSGARSLRRIFRPTTARSCGKRFMRVLESSTRSTGATIFCIVWAMTT